MDSNAKNKDDDAGYGSFVVGARNYPPSEKATRPLDIFWEWNYPGKTSWRMSWVVVPSRPYGYMMGQ